MGSGAALIVDYPAGANIVCDWCIFSEDRDGIYIGSGEPETPTPTETATATVTPVPTGTAPATSLPNIGNGATITSGSNAWLFAPFALICAGLFIALCARQGGSRS